MKDKGRVSRSDGRAFQVEGKAHERAQRQEVYHVLETENFYVVKVLHLGLGGAEVSQGSGWD